MIELLVVAGITAMIVVGIGACLVAGIRAWDSARGFSSGEGNAALGIEIMRNQMGRYCPFFDVDFKGEEKDLSFPVIGGIDRERVGGVRFFFSEEKKAVLMNRWIYPDSPLSNDSGEEIISGVEECSFSYEKSSSGRSSDGWGNEYVSSSNAPGRVRLTMTLLTKSGMKNIETTMLIETGPWKNDE